MNQSKQETAREEHKKFEVVLGSCLTEGEISADSCARRTQGEAFGISLVIESVILGLLLLAPLLTRVAQPQFRPILPAHLTFFQPELQPQQDKRFIPPATSHKHEIYDPFQPIAAVHTSEVVRAKEPTGGSDPYLEGAGLYDPGAFPITEGGVNQLVKEAQPVPQPVQAIKHPLKLSEGVLQAQLISRVEPRYPALAVQTKTEGVVRLHAIISRDGRITSLDILSGHPLLVQAALEAVSQWRYRPTMLNGEPVEVETSITVIFRLHN